MWVTTVSLKGGGNFSLRTLPIYYTSSFPFLYHLIICIILKLPFPKNCCLIFPGELAHLFWGGSIYSVIFIGSWKRQDRDRAGRNRVRPFGRGMSWWGLPPSNLFVLARVSSQQPWFWPSSLLTFIFSRIWWYFLANRSRGSGRVLYSPTWRFSCQV